MLCVNNFQKFEFSAAHAFVSMYVTFIAIDSALPLAALNCIQQYGNSAVS